MKCSNYRIKYFKKFHFLEYPIRSCWKVSILILCRVFLSFLQFPPISFDEHSSKGSLLLSIHSFIHQEPWDIRQASSLRSLLVSSERTGRLKLLLQRIVSQMNFIFLRIAEAFDLETSFNNFSRVNIYMPRLFARHFFNLVLFNYLLIVAPTALHISPTTTMRLIVTERTGLN